jgi:quinol-cytochrome oxidoreductase complex cytochrome b subunit
VTLGKRGVVTRHWRGEYSLARSFWLHYLFIPMTILFLIVLAQSFTGSSPTYGALLGSGSMIVLVGAIVWGLVGTWRSAKNTPRGVGRTLAMMFLGAQLVAVIGAFVLALMYLVLSALSGPPH